MNAGANGGGVGGINFYPSQPEVHNEVSFSQVSASEMMGGNINNRDLLAIFENNFELINELFEEHSLIELGNDDLIIHE